MPIITISRGTFSKGKELAEVLAGRLNFPCLSREEILEAATKEYGISVEELTAAMNKPPPFWLQMPSKRFAYLKCVTAVLLEHARAGDLVYHGHAGHLLLSGISHLIRIRLIAPMTLRAKIAMEQMNLEYDDAVARIEKIDRERNKWSRFLYGIDWRDAHLYDAVFNLEHNTIEGICEMIICMTQLDQFKVTPESQKVLADFIISSKVWAELAKDKRTRAASIRVVADKGVVTITGGVGSEKTVDTISKIAQQVEGVTEVRNEVGVGTDWYW